jgi:hypothetical protein
MQAGRLGAGVVAIGVLVAAGTVASAPSIKPAPKPAREAAPWPAPADPMRLTRAAGLRPEPREQLAYHVHAHLDVFLNGKHVTVPAGIGINTKDPDVHTFTDTPDGSKAYGGIDLCKQPCISPLHTHDNRGVIHTESATPKPNRLGQFFTEWHVRLGRACVGGYCKPDNIQVYVNGKLYTGDPRAIELGNHKEIAIVIGTPPAKIPTARDVPFA